MHVPQYAPLIFTPYASHTLLWHATLICNIYKILYGIIYLTPTRNTLCKKTAMKYFHKKLTGTKTIIFQKLPYKGPSFPFQCVGIFQMILCTVNKLKTVVCTLKGVITSEKGIVRARNNLDPIISASYYY